MKFPFKFIWKCVIFLNSWKNFQLQILKNPPKFSTTMSLHQIWWRRMMLLKISKRSQKLAFHPKISSLLQQRVSYWLISVQLLLQLLFLFPTVSVGLFTFSMETPGILSLIGRYLALLRLTQIHFFPFQNFVFRSTFWMLPKIKRLSISSVQFRVHFKLQVCGASLTFGHDFVVRNVNNNNNNGVCETRDWRSFSRDYPLPS